MPAYESVLLCKFGIDALISIGCSLFHSACKGFTAADKALFDSVIKPLKFLPHFMHSSIVIKATSSLGFTSFLSFVASYVFFHRRYFQTRWLWVKCHYLYTINMDSSPNYMGHFNNAFNDVNITSLQLLRICSNFYLLRFGKMMTKTISFRSIVGAWEREQSRRREGGRSLFLHT